VLGKARRAAIPAERVQDAVDIQQKQGTQAGAVLT
jgi:hypothetical protein